MSLNVLFAEFRLRPALRQCMLFLSTWSWELVVARNALKHTRISMESKLNSYEDNWLETYKPYILAIAAIAFIVMVWGYMLARYFLTNILIF